MPPEQTVLLEPGSIEAVGPLLTVIGILKVPVTAGFEETTRMIYPVPGAVPKGMVALMVPAVVPFMAPMAIGVAKLPLAFDSCAVNTLPALYVPEMVNGT